MDAEQLHPVAADAGAGHRGNAERPQRPGRAAARRPAVTAAAQPPHRCAVGQQRERAQQGFQRERLRVPGQEATPGRRGVGHPHRPAHRAGHRRQDLQGCGVQRERGRHGGSSLLGAGPVPGAAGPWHRTDRQGIRFARRRGSERHSGPASGSPLDGLRTIGRARVEGPSGRAPRRGGRGRGRGPGRFGLVQGGQDALVADPAQEVGVVVVQDRQALVP